MDIKKKTMYKVLLYILLADALTTLPPSLVTKSLRQTKSKRDCLSMRSAELEKKLLFHIFERLFDFGVRERLALAHRAGTGLNFLGFELFGVPFYELKLGSGS